MRQWVSWKIPLLEQEGWREAPGWSFTRDVWECMRAARVRATTPSARISGSVYARRHPSGGVFGAARNSTNKLVHSARKAVTGSIRVARHAGTRQATSVIITNKTTTAARTIGSLGLTSYSIV